LRLTRGFEIWKALIILLQYQIIQGWGPDTWNHLYGHHPAGFTHRAKAGINTRKSFEPSDLVLQCASTLPAQKNLLIQVADNFFEFRNELNGLLYNGKTRFLSHIRIFKVNNSEL
jgi:hypothetical protein